MSNLSDLKEQLLELLEEEQVNTNAYIEMLTPASTATEEQINAQREKIVTIYNHRQNLYQLIQEVIALHESTSELVDNTYQDTSSVSSELRSFLEKKDEIAQRIGQDTETKKQLIAANMNYGKQYHAYRYVFITIVIILACLIVVSLLSYTPLFFITRPLNIAIYIIGGAYLTYLMIHLLMKSDINNDEYKWMLSPNNRNMDTNIFPSVTGMLGIRPHIKNISACVGEYCCDEAQGTVWSDDSQTCVAN
jgi:hypothetical protein